MPHQSNWASAFAAGLKRHGWKVEHLGEDEYKRADLLCTWGIRRQELIDRAIRDGCEVCILERGYVGDRKEYSSVSFGGKLNGRAEFRGPFEDPSRWKRLFPDTMKPWRSSGKYALIMGQVPGDTSVRGVDLDMFYRKTEAALRGTGWDDVRLRPHPVWLERAGKTVKPLLDDMSGAGVIVTYNSNSGVDAALAGCPVIAYDRGSMVWDIAGHNADEIKTPDRTGWANALAWKQWTKDEMANGECWEAVGSA